MMIDQNGYVGIGTTGPATILHIVQNTSFPTITLEAGSASVNEHGDAIVFKNWYGGGMTSSSIVYDFYGDYFSNASHGLNILSGRPGFANIWFRDSSGNIIGGFRDTSYSLNPTLASTDNFLVGGSVGIGTTGPLEKLDIASNPSIFLEGNSNSWGFKINVNDYGNGNVPLRFIQRNGGVDTEVMRITQGGNVGIGTTAPGAKLQVGSGTVNDTGFAARIIGSDGNQVGFGYSSFGSSIQGRSSADANSNLALNPWGGYVGIGTTNPGEKLEVNGNIYVSGSNGYIRFPHAYGDGNDGKIGNSMFAQGLNLVGINNDNTYRKIQIWGGITQNQNDGGNTWIGNSYFPGSGIWNSAGYVGIGTTGPVGKFTVVADTPYTSGSGVRFQAGTSGNYYEMFLNSSSGGYSSIQSYQEGIGTAPLLLQPMGGSVGIGTTNPGYNLDVRSPSTSTIPYIQLWRGSGYAPLQFYSSGDGTHNNAPVQMWTYGYGGSENLNFLLTNWGGNYYFDTNANDGSFHMVQFYSIGGGSSGKATGGGGINVYGNGNVTSHIDGTGNTYLNVAGGSVGIGTTAPQTALQVIGEISAVPSGFTGNPGSGAGNVTVAGSVSSLNFWRRSLTGFPSTPAAGDRYAWYNPDGTARLWTSVTGDVLTIASNGTVTIGGVSKLNVSTIDPVYTIGGEKFATYGPEMTGINVETTGDVQLTAPASSYRSSSSYWTYVLDLANAPKGSDLWLWTKTTNLKNVGLDGVSVLLTPSFDGKVWYEKDRKDMTITIYAEPSSSFKIQNANLEISYRLSAPRFDSAKWPNTSSENVEGMNLDKLIK